MAGPSFIDSGYDGLTQPYGFRTQDATTSGPRGMSGYAPGTFRNIIKRPVGGAVPDHTLTHFGAMYSDQPGHVSRDGPSDVDAVQLRGGYGAILHDYGPVTGVDQGDTFTIPGADLPGLGWYSLWNMAGSSYDDPRWSFTQGGTTVVVVPAHAGMAPLPATLTPFQGISGLEYDTALWSVLGCNPARMSILLRAGSIAGYESEAAAARAIQDTYMLPYDTNRLRSDGAPVAPYHVGITNFQPGDGPALTAALQTGVFASMAATGRLIVGLTNEPIGDGSAHEGGALDSSYAATQREGYLAIKAANPLIRVATAAGVGVGPLKVPQFKGFLDACVTQAAAHGENFLPFDVVNFHVYNQAEGAPGYGKRWWAPFVALLNSSAYAAFGLGAMPRMVSEAAGSSARQEGGGYPWRQAARVMLDLRTANAHGVSPEYWRYFDGFGGFPWHITSPIQQGQVPEIGGNPFPVVGLLWNRKAALQGTAQLGVKVLNFGIHDDFYWGNLHRQAITATGSTKGRPNPAGTAVVELQSIGDPDGKVLLQLSKAGGGLPTTVVVWDGHGCAGTLPVDSGGKVLVDREALAGFHASLRPNGRLEASCTHKYGLLDGAYIFLPAGVDADAVDPDASLPGLIPPEQIGVVSSAGSLGGTQILSVVQGPLRNKMLYEGGNITRDSQSIWQAGQRLQPGSTQRIRLVFTGPKRVRWVRIPSAPPWQIQSCILQARIIGKRSGVEADIGAIDVPQRVEDLRADQYTFSSWFVLFDPDQPVQTRYFDETLDELILEVSKTTYGSAPSLEAFTANGDCSLVRFAGPDVSATAADVNAYDNGFFGAGFGGAMRTMLQTVQIRGSAPSSDGAVPAGPLRFLVKAT